jgi:hypothetical protein
MSDLFSNVKPGDMVHYQTPQGQHGKGKVVLRYDTHVVVNRGKGQPQVVNDRNYVKHERGGKVIGALLSRLKKESTDLADWDPAKAQRIRDAVKKRVKGNKKPAGPKDTGRDYKPSKAGPPPRRGTTSEAARFLSPNNTPKGSSFDVRGSVVPYTNTKKKAGMIPAGVLSGAKRREKEFKDAAATGNPRHFAKEDAHDAEGKSARVAKTKRHLKKKMIEARDNEYYANQQMADSSKKKAPGHYLSRDGRHISGPHTSSAALDKYKSMGNNHGVKIVQVKEDVEIDVTAFLLEISNRHDDTDDSGMSKSQKQKDFERKFDRKERQKKAEQRKMDKAYANRDLSDNMYESKVKKAAQKAISLAKKAKGNKHVDTEPSLDIQDKGTGGPMEGSHESDGGDVRANV